MARMRGESAASPGCCPTGALAAAALLSLPAAAPVDEPAAPVDEPAAPVDEPAAPVDEPAASVDEPAERPAKRRRTARNSEPAPMPVRRSTRVRDRLQ